MHQRDAASRRRGVERRRGQLLNLVSPPPPRPCSATASRRDRPRRAGPAWPGLAARVEARPSPPASWQTSRVWSRRQCPSSMTSTGSSRSALSGTGPRGARGSSPGKTSMKSSSYSGCSPVSPAPSTGVASTARSSLPEARPSRIVAVCSSCSTSSSSGYLALSGLSNAGSRYGATVGITPRCRSPLNGRPLLCAASASSSTPASTARARSATASPDRVRSTRRVVRSTSRVPSVSSSAATAPDKGRLAHPELRRGLP